MFSNEEENVAKITDTGTIEELLTEIGIFLFMESNEKYNKAKKNPCNWTQYVYRRAVRSV